MDVEHYGSWFKAVDGRWVNLAHCDAIEPTAVGTGWEVRAWNALQPNVDAYVLWCGESESAAQAAAVAIVQAAAQATHR